MIKLLKDSFGILKNNMIFIQPLLLLLLFVLTVIPYLSQLNTNIIAKSTLFLSIALLTCAIYSGWLYINKLGIESYIENEEPENITKKSIENFKKFFLGIGEKFLKCLGAYILYTIIWALIFFGLIKFSTHFYGIVEISNLQQNAQELVKSLSVEQLQTLSKWILTFFPIVLLSQFGFILYNASLFFDNENIFKCLINTIIFLFKNLGRIIAIILFIFLLQVTINAIIPLFNENIIGITLYIICSIIYFNFYAILTFRLYSEKTEISSNNRTEFIG